MFLYRLFVVITRGLDTTRLPSILLEIRTKDSFLMVCLSGFIGRLVRRTRIRLAKLQKRLAAYSSHTTEAVAARLLVAWGQLSASSPQKRRFPCSDKVSARPTPGRILPKDKGYGALLTHSHGEIATFRLRGFV